MTTIPADVTDEIFARTARTLRDLCAISSESGNAAGIRRLADSYGSELTRLGLHVEIAEEPDAHGARQPVLFARGPSAGKPHLLLLGHMDTVLPAVEPRVEKPVEQSFLVHAVVAENRLLLAVRHIVAGVPVGVFTARKRGKEPPLIGGVAEGDQDHADGGAGKEHVEPLHLPIPFQGGLDFIASRVPLPPLYSARTST